MMASKIHPLRSLVLVLAVATVMTNSAWADDSNVTMRTFAEYTGKNGPCVDWEADSSRRIVAHRAGGEADVLQFGSPGNGWFISDFVVSDHDGNLLLDLRDTTWVQVPVVHITESGAEQIQYVYWLADSGSDPETGLTAKTGPDGDVINFVSFGISRIDPGAGFNGGKYRVLAGGEAQLCVSMGLFNK